MSAFYLVVHDMFDPERNRSVFQRDFSPWIDPYEGVLEQAIDFRSPFQKVEFIDENHLYVEYYSSKDELVKETLEV